MKRGFFYLSRRLLVHVYSRIKIVAINNNYFFFFKIHVLLFSGTIETHFYILEFAYMKDVTIFFIVSYILYRIRVQISLLKFREIKVLRVTIFPDASCNIQSTLQTKKKT